MSAPKRDIIAARVIDEREADFRRAIRALAKYKFWMFGYHAASWVRHNRMLKGTPWHQGSPFKRLVEMAVVERGELDNALPHEIHAAKRASDQFGEAMFNIDAEGAA
ncbi:MAG: hypothetical protein GY815_07260 [Gammaproteobacteria bacterium]|nr:hypothetical protein [Gammaproteobacteria bacterium]